MAFRLYFCAVASGDGLTPETAYRTWFQDAKVQGVRIIDMRPFHQIEDGYFVVWGTPSDVAHALAILQPSVTYLPLENGLGFPLALNDLVSAVSTTNRQNLIAKFAEKGIPTAGIQLNWTIGQALRLLQRRMRLGLLLQHWDFYNPTAQLNAMNPLELKAVRKALTAYGFDLSGITGTMTEAEAIAVLSAQLVMDTYVDSEPGIGL